MIGGGVTPEGTNIKRFLPRTIDEDQWQSADRAIVWLWNGIRRQEDRRSAKPRGRRAPSRGSTSSGRSTAPSTCRPTSPRSAGWSRASAPRSTWCSRSARISPTCRSWSNADVNVCMYREFGRMLCEELERPVSAGADRPAFDDQVPAHARRAARPRSRAVHRAREAHHDQADLGSVALA